MLPQGMFSVAIATVLFPTLAGSPRAATSTACARSSANGMRQILLLLIPAAAARSCSPTPIMRLIYQHGAFGADSTELVSTALFWFSFSLPFSGVNLLLTRTFFSVQRPWITTGLAALNLIVNVVVCLALYKPLGIAGLVIGTRVVDAAMTRRAGALPAPRAARPARRAPHRDRRRADVAAAALLAAVLRRLEGARRAARARPCSPRSFRSACGLAAGAAVRRPRCSDADPRGPPDRDLSRRPAAHRRSAVSQILHPTVSSRIG